MKRILFILCVFLTHVTMAWAGDYPSPIGYVNDFDQQLTSYEAATVEKKLRAYEQQTEIEIVVVLPTSLNGLVIEEWSMGLAEKWRVGKEGADNGLILTIAPNERKCRIEVGYGLEGDITDFLAGRIIDDVIVPYLKKGDFFGAVHASTDAIIKELGMYSVQERQRRAQQRAESERIKNERAKKVAWFVAIGVAVLGFFSFAFRFLSQLYIDYQRKNELRTKFTEAENGLNELQIFSESAVDNLGDIPLWAIERTNELNVSVVSLLEKSRTLLESAREKISSDPDSAEKSHGEICEWMKSAYNEVKLIKNLPQKVVDYRKNAVISVQNLQGSLSRVQTKKKSVTELGIIIDISSAKIAFLESDVIALEARLTENGVGREDDSRAIADTAFGLEEKASDMLSYLIAISESRDAVVQFVEVHHSGDVVSLVEDNNKCHAALERIKLIAPESVWHSLAEQYKNVPANLHSFIESIGKVDITKNSFESDIAANIAVIEKMKADKDSISDVCKSIATLEKEIAEAQSGFDQLLKSTSNSVDAAKRYLHKSDVKQVTKSKLRLLDGELSAAKEMAQGSLVDWILLTTCLVSLKGDANSFLTQAKRDVSAASSARRSSSYSSSSGGGGGGFGGFGGGGFGGGGASGGW